MHGLCPARLCCRCKAALVRPPLDRRLELILQTAACMRSKTRNAFVLAVFALLSWSCGHGQIPLPAAPPGVSGDSAALTARGEIIVRNAAVCGGCHSASERDPDGPLSGGREFRDWRIGVARASNLTPDNET